MGDPRRLKKKYKSPMHPWQKLRMEEETPLIAEYGLKNKRELWKEESVLRRIAEQAKELIRTDSVQAQKEKKQLLERIYSLGLVKSPDVPLDDVLGLTARSILERRLQTIVYKKKFANSIKKARQFITHGHVMVADSKITAPSHLVTRDEEERISMCVTSPFADSEHPERTAVAKAKKERPSAGRKGGRDGGRRFQRRDRRQSRDGKK